MRAFLGRIVALALAAILALTIASPATAHDSPFDDVPHGAAFYREITWLHATGITTGVVTEDGSLIFDPTADTSREAWAAWLYRFAGEPEVVVPDEPIFLDVPTSSPFAAAITWTTLHGYFGDAEVPWFRPTDETSRRDAVVSLYRLMDSPRVRNLWPSPFIDVPVSRGEDYRAVLWAYRNGITTGVDSPYGLRFYPADPLPREAGAAFLYRTAPYFSL